VNVPLNGWLFFLLSLFSFGLCYLMVPLCKFLSRHLGLLDVPGGHKAHEEATPLLGGLAVFVSVWLTLGLTAYQGIVPWSLELQGIFLGSTLIFVMGLVDDFKEISPAPKFIVQIGAALIVVIHGVSIDLFLGENIITYLLTIIWIVGITNSFNMLDNMDGLTSGVAAICALIFSMIAFRQQDGHTAVMTSVLVGSLLAFLRFNFDPSELFLGDAGSGFIGFFLGSLAVSAHYLQYSRLQHLPIITPILIFSVPLFDTASVMIIRILEGRPVWEADNRHFSHRLVELGLSRRAAVLIIYLVAFTVGILAVFLTRVNLADALLLLLHGGAVFAIIVLLEYSSQLPDRQRDQK